MATAETVDLDATHAPKEESIKAFDAILPDLKKDLVHMRRERSSALTMSFCRSSIQDPQTHPPR